MTMVFFASYDYLKQEGEFGAVEHGDENFPLNIVFVDGSCLCPQKDNCEWCTKLRRRVLSRIGNL